MPAIPVSPMYEIKNLKLASDGAGMSLSLSSANASAYALCFSQNEPVTLAELQSLSEDELRRIFKGGTGVLVKKERFRIQGVTRNSFHAMPVFRNFQAIPPEQIQVFAMSYDAYQDQATLYVPTDGRAQIVFVPLRYKVTMTPQAGKVLINVKLLDEGAYTDGALSYKMNENAPALPIPAAWLGKTFPVRLRAGDTPGIVVSDAFAGKFMEA